MRGKAECLTCCRFAHGITPAYAGKSESIDIQGEIERDHPRVCGEKFFAHSFQFCLAGSPPRMRGKETLFPALTPFFRITPAYAGKSRPSAYNSTMKQDHPRVCGEKLFCIRCIARMVGSPPRMRGKGLDYYVPQFANRITPAYAGKSRECARGLTRARNHPRVCGEKCTACRAGRVAGRITPAYAGKRLKRSRSTVSPVAIVPLFPSVCNKPVVSDGSPAGRDAPLFLPAENAVPASPAYNLRSL